MNAINEAQSIEQVAEIINDSNASEYHGGSDTRSAEKMAGQYAWEAAKESGYTDKESIEAQLDFLVDAGANFVFDEAAAYSCKCAEEA